MFGKESSDNKDLKREIPPLFRRDEDDSCPYYPPGDDEKCTDSDSSLFARASDPNTAKKMTLSFLSTKNKFTYLRYPRCNAKNNGPSSVAKVGSHGNCVFLNEKGMLTSIQKWYLPEFMLSSSTDINDNRRCSAKTTKENSVQGANNVYYVDGNSDLSATNFRSEHVFEVHLVSHFLEWVCGGTKEAKYGNLRSKLAFPKDWKPADSTWCNEVFGGSSGGMTWSRNNGPKKNWVQHTADVLGSASNTDLLVLYHDLPNGVKKVITEGNQPDLDINLAEKGLADKIMMSATVFDYIRTLSDKWTKPSQDIELISDEFDHEYSRQYVNSPPSGKALEKPKAPRDIKH
ncbi:hypothetical protein N7499_012267 [Penicillium canescens]|uniref:Uncharacterized protein n=1 Tax=Penicillium canescens TaxID=5083 RepID=A0AAD6I451_PENCN|nr:uncharacterized protein N7446_001087 [Penicillium canescens]KAJ6013126.1 hypothetical protein N7522_003481 [Penicillium canescens]KAJ6029852.1 hypothetical protein N7460_010118 [Penicillium canescens]KAJ6060232.1 hypothetical protein N7444_002086 [Penicillium canescens]KAJ6063587.1 hypothetical protein N7499_012267 [Penicillium canescens]KAJ6078151.1 hypothetical protein N7446_001087 [Penicillium canescens]